MANDASTNPAIAKRIREQKEELLKFLRERPQVAVAYKRVGISRATFYLWRDNDSKFAQQVEEAKVEGRELLTEIAETQLAALVKDKHFQAIRYLLEHNSSRYGLKPADIAEQEAKREQAEAGKQLRMAQGDPEFNAEVQEIMDASTEQIREAIVRSIKRKGQDERPVAEIPKPILISVVANGSDPKRFRQYKLRLTKPNEYFVPAVLSSPSLPPLP